MKQIIKNVRTENKNPLIINYYKLSVLRRRKGLMKIPMNGIRVNIFSVNSDLK